MTPGARIAAAIEIMTDLEERPRAADKAVREWGAAHRFAGSKDRAAIRSLVFEAFRHKGLASLYFEAGGARAEVLTGLRLGLGVAPGEIAAGLTGERHSAAALSPAERAALDNLSTDESAAERNWPAWQFEMLVARFGERAAAEAEALLEAAPLDIRINPARTKQDDALSALHAVGFPVKPARFSPLGLRIARDEDLIGANIRTLPMFRSGAIDIQDEGSQLVALMAEAKPNAQVLDLCAGGGGKTVALAGQMGNTGQIYACDVETARLKAGQERVQRAGIHNVQPRLIKAFDPAEGGADPDLEELAGKIDLAFLDVPCAGSGAWRRQPDAKWRLTPERFARYLETQASLLRRGARLVKPGGRLVYVTCSVFPAENEAQIEAFMAREKGFRALDAAELFKRVTSLDPPAAARTKLAGGGMAIQFSPLTTGTDGFFFAAFERT